MLTIEIRGPMRSGKTWVALALEPILGDLGATVTVVGEERETTPASRRLRLGAVAGGARPLEGIELKLQTIQTTRTPQGGQAPLTAAEGGRRMLAAVMQCIREDGANYTGPSQQGIAEALHALADGLEEDGEELLSSVIVAGT